jgi:hypothetical protein
MLIALGNARSGNPVRSRRRLLAIADAGCAHSGGIHREHHSGAATILANIIHCFSGTVFPASFFQHRITSLAQNGPPAFRRPASANVEDSASLFAAHRQISHLRRLRHLG